MKLAIGTAQFGLKYGISNKNGKTPLSEIKKILNTANKNQIKIIDTASLYGESEKTLGLCLQKNSEFKIVTKTPFFDINNKNKVVKQLNSTFEQSLNNLKQSNIYGLLIHNTNDIFTKHGEIILKEILKLKEKRLIQKIGFSVYNPEQVKKLINSINFDIIQLPINIFDQRLIQENLLLELKNLNVEIHARSVFLQGLLLMNLNDIPNFFDPIKLLLNKYHKFLIDQKISAIEATLNFVKNIKEIDYIVIGINNNEQLLNNIKAYKKIKNNIDFSSLACPNETFINPSKWNI